MIKHILLLIIAIIIFLIKWLFVSQGWNGILPFLNFFSYIALSFLLAILLNWQKKGSKEKISIFIFVIFHLLFYGQSDIYKYKNIPERISERYNISEDEAKDVMNEGLLLQTGNKGFIGYLLVISTQSKSSDKMKEEWLQREMYDETDLINAILDFIPDALDWLFQKLFNIQIGGGIRLIFWYIVSWLIIYAAYKIQWEDFFT